MNQKLNLSKMVNNEHLLERLNWLNQDENLYENISTTVRKTVVLKFHGFKEDHPLFEKILSICIRNKPYK